MDKKLYKARFSTQIKVGHKLDPVQIDNFKSSLSQASNSMEHLKLYLPAINKEENPDLLPIAFDSSVINLVNGNDDAILSSQIKALAKTIPFKFINVEHNRSYVVGVISSYGFASLEDKKEIKEEDVEGYEDPYYLCMGGVVWKSIDPHLGTLLEECSNENSPMYQEFSTSWELGFNEYSIALGSKKLKDAEIISDTEKVKEMSKYLKCNGGQGFLNDGTPIYRVIADLNPLFEGVGITSNPAAAVRGIATASQTNFNKIDKIISQPANLTVIRNNMRINDVSEITDDKLNEITASAVRDFIKEQIRNKDQELATQAQAATQDKARLETEVESFKTQASELKNSQDVLNQQIAALQSELTTIKAAQDAAEKAEKFNVRMQGLSESFDLDDRVRTIVASEIQDLDDSAFEAWKNKFEVIGIGFKKSAQTTAPDATAAAQTILASAKVVGSEIPNTPSSSDDIDARFKKAFKIEISKNKIQL